MNALSRSLGFSLIELMITVAVLAIIVVTAAPNLQTFLDKNRIVGAAEAIYSEMQFARSEAVKQSRNMVVVFSPAATPWCSGFSRDDGSPCDCTRAVDHADACSVLIDGLGTNAVLKVVSGTTYGGVTMDAGTPASLTFNGVRGTTGAAGAILLQSAQGKRLQVEVNALGRVRLCSPAGSGAVGGYPAC